MPKARIVVCLIIALTLAACGRDDPPPPEDGDTAAPRHEQRVPRAEREGEAETGPVSAECGEGGTACPDSLECVIWRNGEQACGPMPVEAAVLVTDTTLGGKCVFSNPADTLPGSSIASVHVIGADGSVKGYGRMVWDRPGFEVAAERGTPPDGTEFTGDACSDSYNLGCDGQAVFEIVGEDGQVQKLREGNMVIVHMRGQETCGEEVADEVGGAICNDPAAAASGNLDSCTSTLRMIEARSDMHGPDRMGGTIRYLSAE